MSAFIKSAGSYVKPDECKFGPQLECSPENEYGNHLLNGILLPKLFWPIVRKNCSSDQEKRLKFKAEVQEFAKFLRPLEQFIQTVNGQNNFW